MRKHSESHSVALLVAGMHRSGTSATAGLLAEYGVDFGPSLVPADQYNPKGYYEHADIWAINHRILNALGSDWDDIGSLPDDWYDRVDLQAEREQLLALLRRDFATSGMWAIKDPRLSRLMPLWHSLCDELGVAERIILVVRHPAEVVGSLMARDGMGGGHAARLWLRYTLDMMLESREREHAVMFYDDVLASPVQTMARLADTLQLQWPSAPSQTRFIEPRLRHHRDHTGLSDLPVAERKRLESVYESLRVPDSEDTLALLDDIRQRLSAEERRAALYLGVARSAKRKVRSLQQDCERLEEEKRSVWGDLQWAEKDRLSAHEELGATRSVLESVRSDLQANAAQLREVDRQLAEVRGELDGVYASRSWRVTYPLRRTAGWLRTGRHALTLSPRQPALPTSPKEHIDPAQSSENAAAASPLADPVERIQEPPHDVTSYEVACRELPRGDRGATRSLRIVMVTPEIVGPVRNGGIGTAFTALARALGAAGHAVTILFTLGEYTESGSIAGWIAQYARDGISLVPLPRHDGPALDAPWDRARAYQVYLWLKKRDGAFDIAYFPDWIGQAYYALLARRLGLAFAQTHLVVVTHGATTWAEEGNFQLPDSLDTVERMYMEQKAVEWCDTLISPSAYLVGWMKGHGWKLPEHVRVIQNLMPEGVFSPSTTPPSAKVREWVFFGRLEPRKGLRLFCDAVDRAPAALIEGLERITFLGRDIAKGDFESLDYLEQRTKHWSCAVSFLTDFDRQQALAYLAQHGRVAVIPSLVENSPYTVLECLLRRIPFVAADVGGIGELVAEQDRDAVLFEPRPASLVACLERVHAEGVAAAEAARTQRETLRRWLDLQPQLGPTTRKEALQPASGAPRVSVCLVHYNRPGYLRQALESLYRQTYENFEVILVDDGSPSLQAQSYLDALTPEFRERGWRIVRQPNAYLGAARNRAVREATGEYLLFMDDDNVAKPHEIETFVKAALASGADILTNITDYFFEQSPPANGVSRRYWLPLGAEAGLGMFRNNFGDANALVRKTTFERVGGFTEDYGIGHEDWEFFARATLRGASLYLLPEPLFWYRVNPKGMLYSGESETDHARSARPYVQALPGGLGASLAFALSLQRATERRDQIAETSAGNERTRLSRLRLAAKAGRMGFNPLLRTKFNALRKQQGWRRAFGKALHYVRHKA